MQDRRRVNVTPPAFARTTSEPEKRKGVTPLPGCTEANPGGNDWVGSVRNRRMVMGLFVGWLERTFFRQANSSCCYGSCNPIRHCYTGPSCRGLLRSETADTDGLGGFFIFLFFNFVFYKNIFLFSKFAGIYPGCPAAGRLEPGRPAAGRQGLFYKNFRRKFAPGL